MPERPPQHIFQILFSSNIDKRNKLPITNVIFLVLLFLILIDLVFLQQGRIGSFAGFSVRKLLFAGIFLTSLSHLGIPPYENRSVLFGMFILGVIVPGFWMAVGFINGNNAVDLINDANGHLYYLLLIPLIFLYENKWSPLYIFHTLCQIVVVFCVLVILTYIVANIDRGIAGSIEIFLREGDYGFINVYEDGPPFRIFLKSFLFVGIVFCYSLHKLIKGYAEDRKISVLWLISAIATLTVLAISQTRSLWLGGLMGAVVVVLFHARTIGLKNIAALLTIAFIAIVLAGTFFDPRISRFADADGNVGYRLMQMEVLIDYALQAPIFGSGFGSPVELSFNGTTITTYSVEMDILNLIRKIGLVGAAIYGAGFYLLTRPAVLIFRNDPTADEVVLMALTLAVVFMTGFFNPYLTSSLGIGAIVIAAAAAGNSWHRDPR